MPATSGTISAQLAPVEIGHVLVLRLVERVEEDALNRPEQIRRRDDDARRRDHREHRVRRNAPISTRNSPTKPFVPGNADAAERHDREQRGEHRHDARDAAVGLDQSRVPPLVDHADEEEQRAGRDAVVDHDHQRALHALHGEREDAEHHEAEVADRRVRDELLEVGLHERHERAVDDADHREHEDRSRAPSGSSPPPGKSGTREAKEAERAELQHDAREDDRARRRRLDVRVGQPGVEREHRHLHGEREEEGAEQPERRASARSPRCARTQS